MQGFVKETTFDEDYEIYSQLKERDKESIGLLTFEFEEYLKLSQGSTGVRVNLETKELEFSYEELPIEPQIKTDFEVMQEKTSQLEQEVNRLQNLINEMNLRLLKD